VSTVCSCMQNVLVCVCMDNVFCECVYVKTALVLVLAWACVSVFSAILTFKLFSQRLIMSAVLFHFTQGNFLMSDPETSKRDHQGQYS
jgi:hypothetical protein